MLRPSHFFIAASVMLLVGACASLRPGGPPLQPPSPPTLQTVNPAAAVGRTPSCDYTVMIESEPAGGVVVFNGIPLGRAPLRILVSGSSRGFFRDEVSLKLRFVATDTDHISQTVEEVFTPLDKIPAGVRFTRQGALRVAR